MLPVFLSGCCICCTGYIRMLQVYISNVSPVSNVCCSAHIHMLQAYIVNVSSIRTYVAANTFTVQVFRQQARLEAIGRGGPLGRSCQAGTTAAQSCIHKCGSRRGARSYIYTRLLSLLIPAGCGRSAAGVCDQAWPVATALIAGAVIPTSPSYKLAR
jgi:hypothetical protein